MFYKILILPLLLFTIYSCSSDKNQEEKVSNNILITKVSNFVSNKENIMAFGHINMFQIHTERLLRHNGHTLGLPPQHNRRLRYAQ